MLSLLHLNRNIQSRFEDPLKYLNWFFAKIVNGKIFFD